MKTIHVVLNAHIDPIWLWPWEAGLDELLATCRSACDRIDANPDIVFTRGEAWVYRQIEMVDPILFDRIRNHVAQGRWEIVGGWWIQPDCNQPSGWAMEKQIAIGKSYFEKTFGCFPRVAYNVDSFGHAATLPALMQKAGQDRYVMMRPGQHEMSLPSSPFRWRGYVDGPEVTTFRISSAYATRRMEKQHFVSAVECVPAGVDHTMVFVGVGDHGGGPTQSQIDWCRDNKGLIDGWEIEFSSPSRFFDSIERQKHLLPLVTGELQMHAIGCYSVFRSVKVQLRRAEHLLAQADAASADALFPVQSSTALVSAWEHVSFHQFHDTLGGTCIPSAYASVFDQLGSASDAAYSAAVYTLRRRVAALPDDSCQRITAWNCSSEPFDGYLEYEPWLEHVGMSIDGGLIDEHGQSVPFQRLESEAAVDGLVRLLFPIILNPGEMKSLRIVRSGAQEIATRVTANETNLISDRSADLSHEKMTFADGTVIARPVVNLFDDTTDTWSHGIDRYSDTLITTVQWQKRETVDSGPIMASWIEQGTLGDRSEVTAEWRVYAGKPYISLDLQIDYNEKNKIVKLEFPLIGSGISRVDGILGGSIMRNNDGRELPMRDWCQTKRIGIVCPDVYALDASPDRLRLTLLRSPLMAHHDPHPGKTKAKRHIHSDQGRHHFRFRFYPSSCGETVLESAALEMCRPPFLATVTKGMPLTIEQ